MKTLLSLLAAGIALASASFSQTPPPPLDGIDPFRKNTAQPPAPTSASGQQIKLVFEAYSLDPTAARDLLVKEEPGHYYERVLEMAKAGKAKLEVSPAVILASGDRVQIEQKQEFKYATEWNPPDLRRPNEKGRANPAAAKDEPPMIEGPNGWAWSAASVPTAFETRNLGLSLETAATMRGSVCDLRIDAHCVAHPGDREVAPGTNVMQPTFEVGKLRISSTVPLGITSLLGTLNGPRDTGVPDAQAQPPARLLFVTATGSGSEPEAAGSEPPPGVYIAVVEVVSMAPEAAVEVGKLKGDEAIKKTLALTAAGEASLEQIVAMRGVQGESAKADSVHEFKYPTEWDPRQLTESEVIAHPEIPGIFTLPIPTAMETRDVGLNLELTANAVADGSWKGFVKSSFVRLDAIKEAAAGSHIFHPEFATSEFSSSYAFPNTSLDKSKTIYLLQTNSPGETPGRSNVMFLTLHGVIDSEAELAKQRAEKLILPKLILQEVPFAEALQKIEELSRQADPDGKGVKIAFASEAVKSNDPTITLSLTDIPVAEAIRYATNLGNCTFTVRGGEFVVTASSGAAQERAPGSVSDLFLSAYMMYQKAERLESSEDFPAAVQAYDSAISLLDQIAQRWPTWNPRIVEHRRSRAAQNLARLRGAAEPTSDGADSKQAELITRKWEGVSPEALGMNDAGRYADMKGALRVLAARGIPFPDGAAAIYLPESQTLVVRSSAEALEMIDKMLKDRAKPKDP